MIHYFCDGSYKEEEHTVACGIVRMDEERKKKYFCYTIDMCWFEKHEEFAIFQSLLYVEKNKDHQVTIWNDNAEVIRKLSLKKENRTKKDVLYMVCKKVLELQEKGYEIYFQSITEKKSPYIKMAHDISRKYIYDEKTKEAIMTQLENESEEHKQERKQMEEKRQIKLEKNLEKPKKETEKKKHRKQKVRTRKVLRKSALKEGVENSLNLEKLHSSNSITFKKVSKKRWAAFNEKGEPIFMNKNIAEIMYYVLREALQQKQTVQVHGEYKTMFASYIRSEAIQKEHKEMIHIIQHWMDENRIEFVS